MIDYKEVDKLVRQAKLILMKDEKFNSELILKLWMIQCKYIPELETKAWEKGEWN